MFPRPSPGKPPTDGESFGGLQEYAQLGIAGIILDGLGTPCRGRKIHDVSYENIHGCAGLADHVGTLGQLKTLFPFLDLDRAGIWGNSGGGCATSRAMLEYPGVYKVGVASAGNHDQRMYENTWTERYYGLYNRETYLKGDNTALAPNLEGKLLLACGMLDDNVPMAQTVRLIDALQRQTRTLILSFCPGSITMSLLTRTLSAGRWTSSPAGCSVRSLRLSIASPADLPLLNRKKH